MTTTPGGMTSYEYDLAGRQTTITDPLGRTTTREYNAAGDLIKETSPGGAVTKYDYDAAGNRTSSTSPEGGTTTWEYDLAGRMTSKTTPRGNVEGADPAAYTWTYEYDGMGNLVEETDPRGGISSYGYDELYRKVQVVDPLGNSTTYAYDGDGNQTSVTNALGNTTTTEFDGLGQAVAVTDPAGNTTTTSYDGDGRVAAQSTPSGRTTTYGYDGDGNRTSKTDPRGNVDGADPAAHTWTYAYDADGNQTAVTDPLGGTATIAYDLIGHPISETNPAGVTVARTIDLAGQLTTVTGANGATTSYTYTPDGHLETVTDPGGGVITYTYDGAGRLTSKTDQLDRTTTYAYDVAGNHVETVLARGNESGNLADWTITTTYDERGLRTGVNTATETRSFTYDDAGQLSSFTDPGGTTQLDHDAEGNLTSVTRGADAFTYTYNTRGLLKSVTYPDGSVFGHTYNVDGQRTATVLPSGDRERFSYDANGNLIEIRHALPDDQSQTFTNSQHFRYDDANRIVRIDYGNTIREAIAIYQRDAAGKPVAKTTSFDTATATEVYEYDPAGRLNLVCHPSGGMQCDTNTDEHVAYAYDRSGNRLSQTRASSSDAGTISYSYDAAHQLTSVDGVTHTYDADGNLTSDGTSTYTYDPFGRLIEVTTSTDTVTYDYDALGNRTGITTGGETSTLTWDLNHDLPLLATAGDTSYWYDATAAPIGLSMDGEEFAVASDALGSIIGVYSRAGHNNLWHTSYTPWGTPHDTTDNGITTTDVDLGYTAGITNASHDNGLLHLRLRDYNPATGRFISTDPLTSPRDEPYVSPYTYVNNQPTNLTDPSGACFWDPGCLLDQYFDIYDTITNDGPPSTNEIRMGIGTGVARGFEQTLYGTLGGGNPGFGWDELGWDGDYLGSRMDQAATQNGYNTGWYNLASRYAESGVYTAETLAGLCCPPGLLNRIDDVRPPYGIRPLTSTERTTLEDALRPDKLDHIFAPKHNFQPLVQRFGSREAAMAQIVRSIGGGMLESPFEIMRVISGQTVVIRGAVVSGDVRIGTAFTP